MTYNSFEVKVYESLVLDHSFSSSKAMKAMKDWAQLVRASWSVAKNPRTVAKDIARFES